jgi:hypothetical protein
MEKKLQIKLQRFAMLSMTRLKPSINACSLCYYKTFNKYIDMKVRIFLFFFLLAISTSPTLAQEFTYGNFGFNVLSATTVELTDYTCPGGATTIPSTVKHANTIYEVTTIGVEAFFYCSHLTSVTIPNSVTTIGDGAFNSCVNLRSVSMPDNVTTIGKIAFWGCTGLTSIIIPGSVTTIGEFAFQKCSGLTDITVNWATPLSVNSNVFYDVNTTTCTLHVPAGTESLYRNASVWKDFFTNELTVSPTTLSFEVPGSSQNIAVNSNINWTVSTPASWATVFPASGSNNDTVSITVTENNTERLRSTAISFTGGGILRTVNIAQSPATLRLSPPILEFSASDSSKNIDVTSDVSIWTASSSDSWVTVSPALGHYNGKVKVTAETNNTESTRTATITVTCGEIIRTVSVRQEGAILSVFPSELEFDLDGGSKTLSVTSNTNWEVRYDAEWLTLSATTGINNGNVTVTAAEYSGEQRTAVLTFTAGDITRTVDITQDSNTSTVTIGLSVSPTMLGFAATGGSDTFNISYLNVSWTATCAEPWVTVSPNSGFNNSGIPANEKGTITVTPNTGNARTATIAFTYEGVGGITRTVSVTQAAVSSGSLPESGTAGPLTWTFENDTLTVRGTGNMPDYDSGNTLPPWSSFRANIQAIVIKEGVTSIGSNAFSNCENLTSMTIPNGVTGMGQLAFSNCRNLTYVQIPQSMTRIAFSPFQNCFNLVTIEVAPANANYSSEDGVLYNKDKTTLIVYPSGKPNSTFTIPGSVTRIADFAILNAYSLTSVTIPNSVTWIGEDAFLYCTGLTTVTIPNSVTHIGFAAFYGCTNLSFLSIPNSVNSFGDNVFYDCTGLREVKVHWATPFAVQANLFQNVDLSACTLTVPAGTKALYEVAPVWKDFGTIVESEEEYPNSIRLPADRVVSIKYSTGTLFVHTPSAEQIDIYTVNGSLLYRMQKAAGEAACPVGYLPSGVWIVRGSSGWVRKTVK